jgi:hypothetical protein
MVMRGRVGLSPYNGGAMPKDYEQSARDHSAAQRDTLRALLGDDAVIHVDIHGVATIRADVLIRELEARLVELDKVLEAGAR